MLIIASSSTLIDPTLTFKNEGNLDTLNDSVVELNTYHVSPAYVAVTVFAPAVNPLTVNTATPSLTSFDSFLPSISMVTAFVTFSGSVTVIVATPPTVMSPTDMLIGVMYLGITMTLSIVMLVWFASPE